MVTHAFSPSTEKQSMYQSPSPWPEYYHPEIVAQVSIDIEKLLIQRQAVIPRMHTGHAEVSCDEFGK